MALKEMEKLGYQAVKDFELKGITIHHRIGTVPVTEGSVIIVGVSSHRKASIEAVSWAIDELK
eukprot:CAMPEP_0170558046 /NCGR_PEP_ID=MMETSP0211-20121228/32377_1 /TAXON_ID=311385 /ORGANISM="Pseudokeronopsis sp., Strain OXSARD2" /LENGTH=62 /DNA_ID=CAMNT_0010869617 /DNA_START=108 /DNA_END=296 /DNA_ORIENTATION=+